MKREAKPQIRQLVQKVQSIALVGWVLGLGVRMMYGFWDFYGGWFALWQTWPGGEFQEDNPWGESRTEIRL